MQSTNVRGGARAVTLDDLRAVAGVPESALDDTTLALLPDSSPPAPWDVVCSAVLWFDRPTAAARAAIDPGFAASGRAITVVGGIVRYEDTPVGPYDEVFGTVGIQRGLSATGSVPFMAVTSPASLVGGRSNWALPKSLATFEGEPVPGHRMTADGGTWRVEVAPRSLGPAIPVRRTARIAQRWPDGVLRESTMTSHGRLRPALVRVTVASSGPLGSWLRSGTRLGAILERGSFSLSEPSPSSLA